MSSSNLTSRRITIRSRSAVSSRDEASSKPNSTGNPGSSTTGGVAALRKRSALGDMTNAGVRKPLSGATSEGGKESDLGTSRVTAATKGKLALRDSNGTAAFARGKAVSSTGAKPVTTATASSRIGKPLSHRTDDTATQEQKVRVARRAASAIPLRTKSVASTASSFSRSNSVQSDASRKTTSSTKDDRAVKRVKTDAGERYVVPSKEAEGALVHKKTASTVAAAAAASSRAVVAAEPKPAKDEGWEDLDQDDWDDPLMVAEYVNEIFEYMREIEIEYIPSGDYIDKHPEITWSMRGVLIDWLIDIHSKFRLVPETLFLATNIVDRFLSQRTISLNKLQLVGLTAMFIAAKYEEVLCPSVNNFLYLAEGGYTDEEILKAERYMLKIIKFQLSYASPMNFLRRISKADNYDIQTRTVGKFFMEISLVDHRLMEHPPSLIAAAAVWSARLVLERGEWCPTLVHYSGYSVEELLPTAELMIDYCLRPVQHSCFMKKYSVRKFMKASTYVANWCRENYGDLGYDAEEEDGYDEENVADRPRVDLFAQFDLTRPETASATDAQSVADSHHSTPALKGTGYDSDEDELSGYAHDVDQDARLLSDVTNLATAGRTATATRRH